MIAHHGYDGFQSWSIASIGLLHFQVHVSVHLHQSTAALDSDRDLGVSMAPHWDASAVQMEWGCHLPPHCNGTVEVG